MSALRLGIVGCGFIGRIHLANALRISGVEVNAVCDVDPEVARGVAEAEHIATWSTDAIEMCHSNELDALVLATHPAVRTAIALEAIGQGKHVLLEKPVAPSVRDVVAIADAVDQQGVVAAVNFKFRAAPAIRGLREVVTAPRYLAFNVAMPRIEDGSPHMDPAVGGGLMPNLGSHVVDLAAWLMRSPIVAVAARAASFPDRSPATPDVIVGQLVHENGHLSSLTISDLGVTRYTSKWLIQSADGRTAAAVTGHGTELYIADEATARIVDPVAAHEVGTARLLESFTEAAAGHGRPIADVAAGEDAAFVVEAVDASIAHDGATVTVGGSRPSPSRRIRGPDQRSTG